MRTQAKFLIAITASLLLAGCGGGADDVPDLSPVSGVVTYKGQPVPNATVTFAPKDGPMAVGTTDSEGKYSLITRGNPGATIGEGTFTVSAVEASNDQGEMTPEDMAKMATAGTTDDPANQPKSLIPEKYNSAMTSGLSFSVKEGEDGNNFDLKLED